MPCVLNYRLLIAIGLTTIAPQLGGQTLFVRPDTTPNYASYGSIEDCKMATLRLTDEIARKDPIWYDTASRVLQEGRQFRTATSQRPDTAITVTKVCLNGFNADTAQFPSLRYANYMAAALLMANRDDDAHRFYLRVQESVRDQPEAKKREALSGIVRTYGQATPVRFKESKQYYDELLVALKSDSLYRTVYAAMDMVNIALRAGDTTYAQQVAWHAIKTHDAIPVKERPKQPGSSSRMPTLAGLTAWLTSEEGIDSIRSSTVAYRKYYANTVLKRVYGDTQNIRASSINVKMPEAQGEYYYVAAADNSSASKAPEHVIYAKKGSVPHGELPVPNRVNLFIRLQAICHAEGRARSGDHPTNSACMPIYAQLRRLKQHFPEIEITILTSTYGNVGMLPPLQPVDEADTLAKLFLGFHHVPARLVVEKTQYFRVAQPDDRRIDLPTPYVDSLTATFNRPPKMYLIDKEGKFVDGGGLGTEVFDRFVEALIKRTSR